MQFKIITYHCEKSKVNIVYLNLKKKTNMTLITQRKFKNQHGDICYLLANEVEYFQLTFDLLI